MATLTEDDLRVRAANRADVDGRGEYVLYWMIGSRRTTWNFGLQRAVAWAEKLRRPLAVFEPLRVHHRWANDRMHRFIVQGMADNRAAFASTPVLYYPYVEPAVDASRGLLVALAARACVVVTDDFPAYFLPQAVAAAARKLKVRLEAVDGNGLLPMRAADRVFTTAASFRRFLQKTLRDHLLHFPTPDPLKNARLPAAPRDLLSEVERHWPAASAALLAAKPEELRKLPIDHAVGPAAFDGGSRAARAALGRFTKRGLAAYDEMRNHPDEHATSGLSPYLHFGQISAHEVFDQIARSENWTPDRLTQPVTGSRTGWWQMSEPAEAFLDQLVTWRELGFNLCWQRDDYDQYESLPDWAQQTLAEHAGDPRTPTYDLDQFERAATHDPVWNAAQRQLVREGQMHNYLRMLWGKKILHWTDSPRTALDIMIELNNKYAVDGRDPNSYSGIFWILGRYDRAWGPERPIFGKIRYMSSDNTVRKLEIKEYLRRYGA